MEENSGIIAKKPQEGGVWDVAIIGSGPSALTAAIYTTRGAASTVILGGEEWGGQLMLTTKVDNFPALPGIQGPDLMIKMKDHATSFGAEFVGRNVSVVNFSQKPFELTAGDKKYLAKSVIVATGAQTLWLGVEGEERLRGKGVSSCAPCDAPFFKGKNVIVVGGGDAAMEEAQVLTKYATTVTIIHRRDKFRASQAMQEHIFKLEKEGKVKIIWNSEVTKLIGDNKLTSVGIKNSKDGKTSELPIDGLFVAIGHVPQTNIFKGKIELDAKNYIKKMPQEWYQMSTSVDGIFVAGDVHDFHYRQAITAAGYGCMAALEVINHLDKDSSA